MVYKRPPYHPAVTGFGADDARFLRKNGFNTVRLGVIYKAVEPTQGRFDNAYLERIAQTWRLRHRLRSVSKRPEGKMPRCFSGPTLGVIEPTGLLSPGGSGPPRSLQP